jgi:acyl-CoA thioesterase-1
MRGRRLALLTLLTCGLGGCSALPGCAPAPSGQTDAIAVAPPSQSDDIPVDRVIEIAFLGDSLTAGLGLPSQQAYPSLIQAMFAAEGYGEVEVVNGGSSGDTTAGGLRRVDQLFGPSTRILVVALGGNDALRGLSAAQTHDNLAAIIDAAQAKSVEVLLAGMQAPTNLGEDYQASFRGAFTRLAREYQDRF